MSCGALEVAAGLYERAFLSADVVGDSSPTWLTREILGRIARQLIVEGNAVGLLANGELILASSWEIKGDYNRQSWRYKIITNTPSNKAYKFDNVEADKVLHVRYCIDKKRSWIGTAPLQKASYAAHLLANIERSLGYESSVPVGYILPVPTDGDDKQIAGLKKAVGGLKGNLAFLETTSEAWGMNSGVPKGDWQAMRLGANVPQSLIQLYELASRQVLAVLGVPIELVSMADGTGKREAWRQFLFASAAPLARRVEFELNRLATSDVKLSFDALNASDIAGRARAFGSLVSGGMDTEEALQATGLLVDDG